MLGENAPAQNVVPLPSTARIAPPDPRNGSEWSRARAILHTEGAACYGAWIAPLQREGRVGGRLTLRAPSRFHATYVTTHLQVRLLAACRAVDADVSEVCITA